MPLSIQFTAEFQSVLQNTRGHHSYVLEVIADKEVAILSPLFDSFHILKTALEFGFLDPQDELYWRDELRKQGQPYSLEFAEHVFELCRNHITFQLVRPNSFQRGAEILLGLQKYDGSGQTMFFPGIITEVMSIRTRSE